MNIENILANLLMKAIDQTLQETKTNPVKVGDRVGNINIEQYGVEAGIVVAIEGDSMSIQYENGSTGTFPIEGTVDTALVAKNYDKLFSDMEAKIRLLALLLGDGPVPQMDGQGDPEIGVDLPTPGCDCPHCATFSAEQHAEAAALEAKQNKTIH